MVEAIQQYWSGSAWENDMKSTMTYNASNQETEELIQYWGGSSWENDAKTDYTYDGNGNLIEELNQVWDNGTSSWENQSRTTHTYGTVGIADHIVKTDGFFLVQNYPNPFNPATTIRFNIPKTSHVQLDVFNVTGKKVASLIDNQLVAGSYDIHFTGQNLPSGIYFYRLTTPQFTEVKHMILQK